jgi:N-acyl homoserine lactone hydrolase
MSDLRLHMFQCGSLKCKLHNIKMNQGLNEPYEIPVPWFLIQHPKGNIVIDGGNAVECVGDPYDYWGSITEVVGRGQRRNPGPDGAYLHRRLPAPGF